jgi:hypothetical protein
MTLATGLKISSRLMRMALVVSVNSAGCMEKPGWPSNCAGAAPPATSRAPSRRPMSM